MLCNIRDTVKHPPNLFTEHHRDISSEHPKDVRYMSKKSKDILWMFKKTIGYPWAFFAVRVIPPNPKIIIFFKNSKSHFRTINKNTFSVQKKNKLFS